jgi:4-hydroxy-2-oxoheptanedioate aldolase
MISTAAEARSVVSLAKFPPAGVRGQGSPFACLEHGLATPSDYIYKANESVVIMVQIETAAGVNNIDEICQVDGVGKFFFSFFFPQI